jgi:hypothetical protein
MPATAAYGKGATRRREGARARRDGSEAGSTRFEHPVEMLDTDAMIGR